jgi:hypothetical protein
MWCSTPQYMNHKWTPVCRPTSYNSSGRKLHRKSPQTAPVRRGGRKYGSVSLPAEMTVWKLKVDTWTILFNHWKVVIWKPLFRRPVFVWHFFWYCGTDSPAVGLAVYCSSPPATLYPRYCAIIMALFLEPHGNPRSVLIISRKSVTTRCVWISYLSCNIWSMFKMKHSNVMMLTHWRASLSG